MRQKLFSSALVLLLLALFATADITAQINQRMINVKNGPFSAVRSTTGLFFSTGQASLNYVSALIRVVPTGSPTGCTMEVRTGPTAALATKPVDDANATITCTSEINKVVNSLDRYWNINLGTLSGGTSPSVTVYVTLTNGVGWILNQTLSAVTQGAAAGTHSSPWWMRLSDGTNDGVIFQDVNAGVGVQGARVASVATVGALSAAVASATMTQVVAAPGTGSIVLLGIFVEKATNTTGTVTVSYGTGANCGTGTTTLLTLGPATASSAMAVGDYAVNALVPATKALCLTTDAATTSARALTQ